jgi:hypothetical protein
MVRPAKRKTKKKIKPVRYQVQSAISARMSGGNLLASEGEGWQSTGYNYKTKAQARKQLRKYVKDDQKSMKKHGDSFRVWRFRVKKIGGRK